jgi:hypothetical protein
VAGEYEKFARSLKPLLLEEQKEQEAMGGKGESNPQGITTSTRILTRRSTRD